jgi:predicted transcriptional regulator
VSRLFISALFLYSDLRRFILRYYNNKKDIPSTYFPMPKSIFNLGLTSGEILVYAYLMYCEDRQTHQCYPSYSTIGETVDMSTNTVKKHVKGLERKGLITTEYTTIKTKDGRTHNGSLLYTLSPLQPIEEAYFQKKIRELFTKELDIKRVLWYSWC